MSTIADLVFNIGADMTDFQKTMEDVQSTMQSVGKKLSGVGKNLTTAVSIPIAAIGGFALKAATDFEQGMSDIKAVSGATGSEMEKLKDLALKMGADTKYSAKEAAKGIEELIKAGVSVEDILNGGLKGALSLATAGELELGEAAEIASTALNAFKADGLNVSKAADILAGAANASATSVRELRFGLSSVSAVASSVGLSFEDTVTALAVFAQNGLKGSDAGTSLKTMLMNLQPQTKQQWKAFEKLNLITEKGESVFFTAEGRLRSMAEIAGTLKRSMSGMTDAQRLQTMEVMFGSDAIRAANILFKEGADGVSYMKGEMGKVTAEEVAAEKMNNFNGAMETLKGNLETAGIKIMSVFLPALTNIVNHITALVDSFTQLDSSTQQIIVVIGLLVAAIGPLLMLLGAIASGIGVLSSAIGAVIGIIGTIQEAFALWAGGAATLTEALGFIMGPIGWIILGLTALGAAVIYFWNTNESFRNALINIWNVIKDAASVVFTAIKTVIESIFTGLQNFWTAWGGTITQIFTGIWEIVKILFTNYFSGFVLIITTIFEEIKKYWERWGPLVQAVFKTLFDILKVIFQNAWNGIKSIVEYILTVINNVIGAFSNALKGNWSGLWQNICNIAEAMLKLIQNSISIFASTCTGIFGALKSNMLGIWNGIWNGIKSILNNIIGGVNKAINALNTLQIDVPDWVPEIGGGKFGFNIPNIPALASGGITTGPTLAMIGEGSEQEAVLPLSKLEQLTNTNSGQVIQIILDGQVIQEYIDNGLGRRSSAFGVL